MKFGHFPSVNEAARRKQCRFSVLTLKNDFPAAVAAASFVSVYTRACYRGGGARLLEAPGEARAYK